MGARARVENSSNMSVAQEEVEAYHIGMLLFPDMTQLDLTGPYEVFSRMPGSKVELLWKSLEPVRSEFGMTILPTMTLQDCPQFDLLFVPGGIGQSQLMQDETVLRFLRDQAQLARYVTSTCTGSLVLGAAGLLTGYKAACHWLSLDLLPLLGAVPSSDRVVVDRNRITGGGVTAGIDFALRVVEEIRGRNAAERIQLALEYDPAPPVSAGSPRTASAELVSQLRHGNRERQAMRLRTVMAAANALARPGGER